MIKDVLTEKTVEDIQKDLMSTLKGAQQQRADKRLEAEQKALGQGNLKNLIVTQMVGRSEFGAKTLEVLEVLQKRGFARMKPEDLLVRGEGIVQIGDTLMKTVPNKMIHAKIVSIPESEILAIEGVEKTRDQGVYRIPLEGLLGLWKNFDENQDTIYDDNAMEIMKRCYTREDREEDSTLSSLDCLF